MVQRISLINKEIVRVSLIGNLDIRVIEEVKDDAYVGRKEDYGLVLTWPIWEVFVKVFFIRMVMLLKKVILEDSLEKVKLIIEATDKIKIEV